MFYLILFILSFIIFNYNLLSIWFSFFLELSCYISPFFWENQFFFLDYNLNNTYINLLNLNDRLLENIYFLLSNDLSLGEWYENKNIFCMEDNLSFSIKKDTNYYLIWLEATSSRSKLVDFYCLQRQQVLLAGETSLSFYRILNKSGEDILFYSIYIINPPNLILYLIKVQCFCFEEILIHNQELINLPILVYLDHSILLENKSSWINIIYLEYIALIKDI